MNMQVKQEEINTNIAWAACDTFRGVVDRGAVQDYILVMLFLKYILDTGRTTTEDTEAVREGRGAYRRKALSGTVLRFPQSTIRTRDTGKKKKFHADSTTYTNGEAGRCRRAHHVVLARSKKRTRPS